MRMVYHLLIKPEELGAYVFLSGDPGRIPLIAEHFEEARPVSAERGFLIHTGRLEGVPVSAVATGIGNPSAVLVLEEMIALGAHTFLRVGTCGSLQPTVQPGHLVIGTAAVRDEGTTKEYIPPEYPAIADPDLVQYLREACLEGGTPYHAGIIHSKDAFYSEIPDYTADPAATQSRWLRWKRAHVLATDMESAGLFVICSLRRRRAGSLLAVVGSTEEGELIVDREAAGLAIPVAIAAMRAAIRGDGQPGGAR